MANVVLKKDFANGDILYDVDLNNNFSVIEAGINANEENLQAVIDQAIEELDQQLIDITADRGWDWNGGDRVTFFKGTTSQVNSRPITNGQLLYNKETGETAMDDNNQRIQTGSGNVVVVSDTQPTNEATKDWIKPITINGTETAEEYFKNSNNQWKKILNQPSGDTLPIGSIAQFGGTTAPTNWLICNGQAVSRETYSELFAVIGTTYGDGNGSTTFNLPDFSSRSPMGIGEGTDGTNTETTTLGQEKGEYKHQLIESELPEHTHKIYEFNTNNAGSWTYNDIAVVQGTAQGAGASLQKTSKTGENGAHNTIHPVLGVNFIIKAKQSIGLVGDITTDITDPNNDAVPNASTVKNYVDEKNIEVYSTDEVKTNKVWIDGKPIYRKTFTTTNLPGDTTTTLGNISSLDTVIDINGIIPLESGTSDTQYITLNHIRSSSLNWAFTPVIANGNVRIIRGSFGTVSGTVHVTVEYTKTTD